MIITHACIGCTAAILQDEGIDAIRTRYGQIVGKGKSCERCIDNGWTYTDDLFSKKWVGKSRHSEGWAKLTPLYIREGT